MQVALRKCCRSCGNVLRAYYLLYSKVAIFQPELRECAPRTTLYLKVAIFQPELREHAPHTTSVLKSCDFPAGAAGARSAYYVCTYKLRFSSRSCRGPGGNRTHCESRRASHETTSKGHFASNKFARRHSESASTRTIPAEGRAQLAEIVKSPQFLNLDHANLRRGSRAHRRNRKKSSVFEPRPRGSPQRVARAPQKS